MTRLSEQQWWDNLEAILTKGDLTTFWAAYATYLQDRNIISRARKILHTAALQTFMHLQGKWITTEELAVEGWYWYDAPGQDLIVFEVLYSDVKNAYYCIPSTAESLVWCNELTGRFKYIPDTERVEHAPKTVPQANG